LSKSNFQFLEAEYPILYNIGKAAEMNFAQDPVTSLFKVRQFGEKLTEYLFEEHFLDFPAENTFHNCLKMLEYEQVLPDRVKDLLFTIKNKGNYAVHQNLGTEDDAKTVLFAAFKVGKWFYETYSDNLHDISALKFTVPEHKDALAELKALEDEYKRLEEKFETLLAEREVKVLPKEQKQAIRQRAEKAASKIELSEAETRIMIDNQLVAAGWEADTSTYNFKKNKTLPEKGRNLAIAEWPCGKLWADYALFIGTDLVGIVEAKKYANDISSDLQQAKTYAELVDESHQAKLLGKWRKYHVPFLFSTNGRPYLEQIKTKSGIWFLDVRNERNRSRALKGWISPSGIKSELEQDLEEATNRLQNSDLTYLKSKNGLGLRDYQIKAIQAVEDNILSENESRRALLAMATGTGKTRTILGLCYRLIKANRFRRILFLVDRNLLASQTFDTFKDTKIEDFNSFLETYQVSGLKDSIPDYESRVHFATVQGMVKRLFYASENSDVLPVDTYDCIIVDEAHRGYLQDKELDEEELNFKDQRDYVSKYRMVLDYFDAYGIGLTATPALHTTEIFGKPVFNYSYREAVVDGYLIDHDPPYIIKTKLSEEGITWEAGAKPLVYDREQNEVVELDALEDELKIDISGFNRQVVTESFNRTVIRELVKELDPESDEKTLIFAATDEHADQVVELLKEEFEQIGVDVPIDSIIKITGKIHNPQEWVRRYKNEKFPSIVVTVDLLTTGVDVPAICNLVFMRRIKSRILYEQMLGRATRRCDEIRKEVFRIYDAVRVYETLDEYTSMKPVSPSPTTTFQQLVDETMLISTEERMAKQVDQLIAKYHRKRNLLNGNEERFGYLTQGLAPDDFPAYLKGIPPHEIAEKMTKLSSLWQFLDELKPGPSVQLVSNHEDTYIGTERGYGKGKQPEDYLEGFKRFIDENRNKIAALQIICTRPSELDRASLKELKLLLDQQGYNTRSLNAAWKAAKNEDIAADIISYIRTLALGSSLISHEQRIRNAVEKVRAMKEWNKVQLKWIERFEKQLLQEEVIRVEDLNSDPFDEAGGFERLDKVFEHSLGKVLEVMNENLYPEIA
jgi:type I restriction enzyme, R subunit